jgi:hypothetical protein
VLIKGQIFIYKYSGAYSVLGPILFVIYINDMPEMVESSTYLFADDTKIFREIREEKDEY